ncbi:NAD(P)-dependent dehydrogenase, short-chain alcohol dehydrogenase family [Flexibacter flexilis DSM 6793]|uniref:NAD(P)-dependent dehydrogenase, short-chain alcohol dehydrogenase family n=1 Tax=Flexibacter flexilis DSM 6793 TaxID=927664 RepID=A0A1I1H2V0_9BACT|nr:SDR family oxidoreductase [Flexibacter flexilis]SFC15783.1 NAD(P)-dependent dehydrogenase, short-chain alcohol dehydrogenase family [Flexibacter flexilis DSM 6793]
MKELISVKDKVILVTGAFGLIGKEISTAFLDGEAKVVLADINANAAETIAQEFGAKYSADSFLVQVLDITSEESAAACMEAIVAKFGRLDVLVNNAAIDAKFDKQGTSAVNASRFENYPMELLRKSVEVNLTGTVLMTQHACRQMLKQGSGNIINVASTYSMVAPNQQLYDFGDGAEIKYKPIDYIASKSFIPNYTRYLATFYAKDNIRCNAIVPHGIFNDHEEKFLKNFARMSPLGRMCNREELNGPFVFLASDASSYMTGSVLSVDGGWTAW